jgi:hypothetical protein
MATTTVSVPMKLAAFVVALGAALGVGAAIGGAAGPIDVDGDDEHVVEHATTTTAAPDGAHSHWTGHQG